MAEVSYEFPVGLPDASMFGWAGKRLQEIPDASEREEAVLTLFKLVDAVLADPTNLKKRRVKKQNATFHSKVGRHEGAIDFLRTAGFLDCDDPEVEGDAGKQALLCMDIAYLTRLTDAHHALAQVAIASGVQAPPLPSGGGFNPYSAISQAVDTTRKAKAPEAWKSEAEKVREEVRQKERELKELVDSAPPVDLKPTAFWLASGRRLEEVVKDQQAMEESTAGDGQLVMAQAAAMRKDGAAGDSKFANADKRRLAQLSKVRAHSSCILRVICPDKSVLQVNFRSADRGDHVLAQIKPLLAENIQELPWYVYQSPPLKRLNGRETLAAAGFPPGASLYLGFEGDKPAPPFLSAALVESMGAPPAEEQRGVNAIAGHFSGEAMGWGQGRKLGGAAPAAPSTAGS
mmetsp:Transcript_38135/g.89406  ORF Transcript_38135/g.89406 Transcript_38135/m.89406 type:complete len:402 (+) Transcript_38135:118-1323(+)